MSVLRLLSFNIHGGRSRDGQRDLARVRALLERFNIDIGVFQEMESRPSRGGKDSDLDELAGAERPHRFFAATMREDKGWYGNLIVSRFPFIRTIEHDLLTDARYEPRKATDAVIDSPLGAIRVVGTHLSLFAWQRFQEAQNLIRLVMALDTAMPHPLLVMGDINEWRPSRLLRFLDRCLTAVPGKATFPSYFPLLQLDRVWHKAPGLRVSAHRLRDHESRILSDHLPLLIQIEPQHPLTP